MASKDKLKKYETKFKNNRINMKRFAYDVIAYMALKFNVPENCICIWEGSENDYVYSNFLQVMSRLLFRHQISLRYKLHMYFSNRYESNKLESFESVSHLLQDVIKQATQFSEYTIIEEVEISLSIACELVIFLYSKNLNLYVKKLAEYWFGCYFHLVKKRFEKENGIDNMYEKSTRLKHELIDDYYKNFVQVYCQSYETSAKNEDLEDTYYRSAAIFKKKVKASLSQEERQQLKEETSNTPSANYITEFEVKFQVTVPALVIKSGEDSAIDVPKNTGLGILPHEELLKCVHGTVPGATSQNLPSESPQESTKHSRGLSRRPKGKSRLCSSVEQGLGQLSLDSSRAKQLRKKNPNISLTNGSTHSIHSSDLKRDEASEIDLPQNTGLGILPHEELYKSIYSTLPSTTSQNLPSENPQKATKPCRGLPGR